jgi:hypothetical protein
MSVQSQDTYVAEGIPLTVIGGGGGGSSNPNPQFSTISALGLSNISSINGVAYSGAGGVPADLTVSSISTLALNSISSINGVAYSGAGNVPSDLTVSSLFVNTPAGSLNVSSFGTGVPVINFRTTAVPSTNTAIGYVSGGGNDYYANITGINSVRVGMTAVNSSNLSTVSLALTSDTGGLFNGNGQPFVLDGLVSASTINCSTINGISTDEIPYPFDTVGPVDTPVFGSIAPAIGVANLTQNISTIINHRYTNQGCFRISSLGTAHFPAPATAAAANASLLIQGGGGATFGLYTGNAWTYAQISSMYELNGGSAIGNGNLDLSWAAAGFPGTRVAAPSTVIYRLIPTADWPLNMYVNVSTLVNSPFTISTFSITTTDLGPTTFVP